MKDKIKILKLIHATVCVGLIFVYILVGKLYILSNLKIPLLNKEFLIYLVIPVVAFLVSNRLFQSQIKKIDTKLNFEENFSIYQSALIIKWAILEMSAILLVVVNSDYFILGLPIILYLIFSNPTESNINSDIKNNRSPYNR